jgi:transcriptional regulator with XRE-family HTH domain
MNIEEKEHLALTGDMSRKASAIRLRAARYVAMPDAQGKDFAEAVGISKSSLTTMEKGQQFPNREVMKYLDRGHRIDFNFMMNGYFAQLPHDVQTALFDQLGRAHEDWGQDLRSNRD